RVPLHARREVRLVEGLAERPQDDAVHERRIAEADLRLGRMDVDVDRAGVHLDEEDRRRVAARLDEAAVRLLDRMLDGPVADRPAVEEDELSLGGGTGDRGGADEPPEGEAAGVVELVGADLEEFFLEFLAEEGEGTLSRGLIAREVEGDAGIAGHFE